MNDELVLQLKSAIKNLKLEIIKKQEELILLLNQYQELTGVNLDIEEIDTEE